jgi:hypothetical protein
VVRYGPLVPVAPDDDPAVVTAQLQETMSAMLDEVQRTDEGGRPAGAWWVPARLGGGAPPHDEVRRRHEDRFRPGGWR